MTPEAHAFLAAADPAMARLIDAHGLCPLAPAPDRTPFAALIRAVSHQQLSGVVAEKILGRFLDRFPRRRFPTPAALLALPVEDLRACGFSAAKAVALRDIAEKAAAGVIPNARVLAALADEEIIERLTQARGVGRWTVEMLLIFKLARPDVLPVDDFGVRAGYRAVYGGDDLPHPRVLREFGERWKPWRSVAAWYLWRAADQAKIAERARLQALKASGRNKPKATIA